MDIKILADATMLFLAPALPYLLGLGGKAAEEGAKKLGADTWTKAKELWGKLRGGVEGKEAAREAAQELGKAPDDTDAQAAFRLQVRRLLEGDPELATEVERLLAAAGRTVSYQGVVTGSGALAQGEGAVAAGAGGVAVGGSVGGGVKSQPDLPWSVDGRVLREGGWGLAPVEASGP